MSFDRWAHRKIKRAQKAKAAKEKQDALDKAATEKAIANGAKVDTGWHASLSPQMKWALENPDNAKYDNDGNPVDSSHWGF